MTEGIARGPGWPTGRTRLAGLVGDPVRHSISPVIHNAAFGALGLDWVFVAFPTTDARAAIVGTRALFIEGLSVTMPHKTAIAGLMDRLTPTAETLRAVNTVVRVGDSLVGHNTDGRGLVDALVVDEGFDPSGRRCLVLGAGGAARAVVLALAEAGAADIAVAARRAGSARTAASLAGGVGRVGGAHDAADADLIVNATPLGMTPGDSPPIDPERLGSGQLVVDLVYHPPNTALLTGARARGAVAANGLGMLLHQAAHAFRLWTGEEAPLAVMSAAALAALARAED